MVSSRLKRLLSFILALVMMISSVSFSVLADENETEVLSAASTEVQVDGDVTLNTDGLETDNSINTIQVDDSGSAQISYNDSETPVVIYVDENGNVTEADSGKKTEADDAGSAGMLPNDNVDISVEDDASAQSDISSETVAETTADMILTEVESDKDGFRKFNINAEAESESSTDFRIYFWEYDGSLPLNAEEWSDYFTDPCDEILIDGMDDINAVINLPFIHSNGTKAYTQATFLNEYRDKDHKLMSVYLEFTLEAGSAMDVDLYAALNDSNEDDVYVMAESVCVVENENSEGNENALIALDYLALAWKQYEANTEEETDAVETETDLELAKTNYEMYEISESENIIDDSDVEFEIETDIYYEDSDFIYETEHDTYASDMYSDNADEEFVKLETDADENAEDETDDVFELILKDVDSDFEVLQDDVSAEDNIEAYAEKSDSEFEIAVNESEDKDDEFEAAAEYSFSYDDFGIDIVNNELPISKDGYLAADSLLSLYAYNTGDIDADSLTIRLNVTIPDEIILPEMLKISANKVKDQDNATWFELAKSAGTKNNVTFDDACIDDNVISLAVTVTGSDDLFADWQIAMYGDAMEIVDFGFVKDTGTGTIELSAYAELSVENYAPISLTSENRIDIGTINESVNDVQELALTENDTSWIKIIPEDDSWSLDYEYNGAIAALSQEYLYEVSPAMQENYVSNAISDSSDNAFYYLPTSYVLDTDYYMKFKNVFFGTDTEGNPFTYNAIVYFWTNSSSLSTCVGVLATNADSSTSAFNLSSYPGRIREQGDPEPSDSSRSDFMIFSEWYFYDPNVGDGFTEKVYPNGIVLATDNDTDEEQILYSSFIDYMAVYEDNTFDIQQNAIQSSSTSVASYFGVIGTEPVSGKEGNIYMPFVCNRRVGLTLVYGSLDGISSGQGSSYQSKFYTIDFNIVGDVPNGATIPPKKYVAQFIDTTDYYDVLAPHDDVDGYYLNGWYTDKELTQKWTGSASTQSDVQLYAEYVPQYGSLSLTKKLVGAESTDNDFLFSLSGFSAEGDPVSFSYTFHGIEDGSETYVFENVPVGSSYTVNETAYDASTWDSEPTLITVPIVGNEVTDVTVTNTALTGDIKFTVNLNTYGYMLDPKDTFDFVLIGTANDGEEIYYPFTVAADYFDSGSATITLSDILVGDYKIVEMLDGFSGLWTPAAESVDVSVSAHSTTQATFQNNLNCGTITVTKTVDSLGADLNDLENMTILFELTGTADIGNDIYKSQTITSADFVDNKYSFYFYNVPYGSYYVTETIIEGDSVWRTQANASQPVTIEAGESVQELDFYNFLKEGYLTIGKYLEIDPQYDISELANVVFVFTLSGTSYAGVQVNEQVSLDISDFNGYDFAVVNYNALPIGRYTITETIEGSAAPAWSASENAVQEGVLVSYDSFDSVYFTNVLNYGSVCVNKTVETGHASEKFLQDAENFSFVLSGTATAGFEFSQSQEMDASKFTGDTATVSFDNVPVGTYEIAEEFGESAADMWDIDGDASQDVPVSANETTDVYYTNILRSGTVTVEKELDFGNYDASDLDDFSFTFTLKADGDDSDDERSITLNSDDFADGKASATFEDVMYGDYVVTEIMDDDAAAVWTPVNGKEHTVTVGSSNPEPEVTFKNKLNTGNLSLTKEISGVDSTDNAFTFVLSGTSAAGIDVNLSHTFSGIYGAETYIFKDVPVGSSYTLTETDYSTNTWKSDNIFQNVKITANSETGRANTTNITVTNTARTGDVEVVKVLKTGKYTSSQLSNYGPFEFTLSGTSDAGTKINRTKYAAASDFHNGSATVTFENVPVGTYTVTESIDDSNNLWTAESGSEEVTVKPDISVQVKFENQLNCGTITVNKSLNIGNTGLANLNDMTLTFTLEGTSFTGIDVQEFIDVSASDFVNNQASVTFTGIPYGEYHVTETMSDSTAATWTSSGSESQPVTIDAEHTKNDADFENVIKTGNLNVVKYLDIDAKYDTNDLSDATFTFTLSGTSFASVQVLQSLSVNASDFAGNNFAEITFTDIPVGLYTVKETIKGDSAPAWSVSDNAVQDNIAVSEDYDNTVYFTNVMNCGSVRVKKIVEIGDASEDELKNAENFTFILSGTATAGFNFTQTEYMNSSDFAGNTAYLLFENVPVGNYTVTESLGELNSNMWSADGDVSHNVTVTANGTADASFTNILGSGSITVTKQLTNIDKYDTSSLRNSSFTFTLKGSDSGSSVERSMTLDADSFTNGTAAATFTDVPYGNYVVTETMEDMAEASWTPVSGREQTASVTADNSDAEVTFKNELNTGSLTVVKYLDAYGYDLSSLDNAAFTFVLSGESYTGISINQSVTISASDFAGGDTAAAVFTDIPAGSYIITEETSGSSAPAWSVSGNAVQDAAVSANENNTVYFTNTMNYGSVHVNKIIDTGNAGLSDIDNFGVFTFTLSGTSTAGIKVTQSRDISKDDFNGDLAQVSFDNIPVGSYKVTESVSHGSSDMWTSSDSTTQDIDVESHGESTVTFTNVLGSGSVTVEKDLYIPSEYDIAKLKECTFTFTLVGTGSDSSIVRSVTFGPDDLKNGSASETFDEIPYGTYVVTETMEDTVDACWTPVNGRIQTVTISPSKSTDTARFENKLNTGNLTVVKYLDEDEYDISSLEDVTFAFTLSGESYAGIDIEQTVYIKASDFEDGNTAYAQFTDIPSGSYVVMETSDGKAAPAWSVSDNAIQDAVVATDDNNTVYFTNVLNYGSVQVYKDIDIGNASITDIENSGVFTFTLSGHSTAGIDVSQSKFVSLEDFSGTRASVMFDNIPVGSYTITEEIEDPANMWSVSGDAKQNVDVETGETAAIEYKNIMSTGSITVTKYLNGGNYDISDLTQYSFTFTISSVDSGSSVLQSVTFTPDDFKNGQASETFTDIPYGSYVVTETMDNGVSADWTASDGTQKVVTLSSENANGSAEFTNTLNTGNLTVVKTLDAGDYDLSSIKDVTFTFALTGTSNAGVNIDTHLSIKASDLADNGTASVTFKDIPTGTYIVTESSEGNAAPAWSISGNASQEAVIAANTTSTAWFANSLNVGEVTVIKNIDAGTYSITDIDAGDYFTFVLSGSSTSGIPVSKTEHIYMSDFFSKTASVTFDNIPVGSYTVTEDAGSFDEELWSIDGDRSVNVDVANGESAEAVFTNKLNLGSVTVNAALDMKGYTADVLEYTYFTFVLDGTSSSGTAVSEELMLSAKDFVNDEASVTFENIPYGTYNVYEIMTSEVSAEWTCADGAEKQVTVSGEKINAEAAFENELNTGDLTVVKTLESGDYDLSDLGNASFTFALSGTSDVGVTIKQQLSVSASDFAGGTAAAVVFHDIPVGSYIVTEEISGDSAPAWSVSGSAVQDIEITANRMSTSYFTNTLNVGEVTVIKNVDTGNFSADDIGNYEYFTFVLEGTASSGIKISKSAHVSASDFSHGTASVTFTDVPVGSYTVSEDMSDLSKDLWSIAGDGVVNVDVAKGDEKEVSFTNKLNLGSVQVNKILDTDNYPADNLEYTYFTFILEGTANSGIHVSETKMINAKDFVNKNADVTFDDIPYGTYDVYEVMTDGVATEWSCTDGAEKQVTVSSSKAQAAVSFTNKLNTGNLTVVKELEAGDYDISSLDDVTFVFTLTGTSDVGMYVEQTVSISASDLAGDGSAYAAFEDVPLGTYIVTESSEGNAAPAWSVSGSASQEATIAANTTSTIWFTNSLNVGEVTVIKNIDAGIYDMSEIDGGDYFTFVLSGTSKSGIPVTKTAHIYMSDFNSKTASVTFDNIPIGTYTVDEDTGTISEELWSVAGDKTVNVDVAKGENAEVAFTNKLNLGSVSVTKYLDTGNYTADDLQYTYFTFVLEGTANSGVKVSEELMIGASDFTDNQANAAFENIPYGTYNVYEIMTGEVAAEWTCMSGAETQVTVSGNNKNAGVSFTNALNTGNLTVVKTLEGGAYDLSELNDVVFTFTLSGISDVGVKIEAPLSVSASDFAGDNTAAVTFRDIPVGTYIIKEEISGDAAPSWSISGNAVQDIEIAANRTTTSYFTNELNTGDVTVIKNIDAGGFGSDNIEDYEYFTFNLSGTATSGVKISKSAHVSVSDFSHGTASVAFTDIPVGSYTVSENMNDLTADLWKIEGDGSINVDVIKGETAEAEFTNKLILHTLTVHKSVDDPSSTISSPEGFEFTLTGRADAGIAVSETARTDANGDAVFNAVPIGTYYVTETKTPDSSTGISEWWAVDGGNVEVKLTEDTSITMSNTYKTGNLTVDKYLDGGENAKNNTFMFTLSGVSNSGVEINQTGSITGSGSYTFKNVPIGTYTLAEDCDEDTWAAGLGSTDVEVGYNSDAHIPVTNKLITRTQVSIRDIYTEMELDGAVYTVYDKDGNEVSKAESRHGTNNVLYDLVIGDTYTVEINAPASGYANTAYDKDGYEPSSGYGLALDSAGKNKVTFTLADTDEVQIVSIFLQPVTANVIVNKTGEVPSAAIDDDGTIGDIIYTVSGLPNAEYDIVAADNIANPDGYSDDIYAKGTVIEHLVTDDTGKAESSLLYLGVYDIVETKAPQGYTRYTSDHTVTVDLSSYYNTNYYMAGNYSGTFDVTEKFYNDRQMLDIGENPSIPVHADPNDPASSIPDAPTQNKNGDPNSYLEDKAGVSIVGVNGDEEVYVEGAELTLYAYEDIIDVYGDVIIPAGTEIEKAVTAENGRASFTTDLPVGVYAVRETDAPYGYYSSNAEIIFDLTIYEDDDEVQIVRQSGTIRNAITKAHLTLADNLTDNELEGATIVITDSNGEPFETIVTENTDGDGYTILGLDPDETYTITEVIPRHGYTWDLIDKDGNQLETGNAIHLTIPDAIVDAELSNVPEDTVIELYNQYVTGHMNLSKNGEVLTDAETDIVRQGDMPLFDYNDKQLEGVEFTVYAAEDIYHPDGITGLLYSEGDVVNVDVRNAADPAIKQTDANGLVLFEGMYLGEYIVAETSVPYGYAVNNIETPFTLVYADYMTIDVEAEGGVVSYTNIRQKVSIEITKYDAEHTDIALEGAVFGLYSDSDILSDSGRLLIPADTLIEMETTDGDGTARFVSDIPLGLYYVMEIAAPDGYTSSYERINIDAAYRDDGRDVINIAEDFYNEITKVEVYKIDADNDEPIEGASLEVLDAWGEVADSWISSEEAHVIEGLAVGSTYTLVEANPAAGYATADPVVFTVLDREQTENGDSGSGYTPQRVEMRDRPITISISAIDITTAEPLEGVRVNVYDDNSRLIYDKIDLSWEQTYVPAGSYTIETAIVPDGYVRPDPVTITVADTEELQQFAVSVDYTKGRVAIYDQDTNESVYDTLANVYNADGELFFENVTLDWIREYLPVGAYTVEVTRVPAGYVTPEPVDIEISELSEWQDFDISLDHIKTMVRSFDEWTGDMMDDDVRANIYDTDGYIIYEDVAIVWAKEYLPAGDYIVEITEVPAGYVLPDGFGITVLDTGEWQFFDVDVDHIKVQVQAIDENTGEKVKGSTVDVYDDNGIILYEGVSLDWVEEYLPAGNYTVQSAAVPDGYAVPDDYNIEVEATGEWQSYEIPLGYINIEISKLDADTDEFLPDAYLELTDANGMVYDSWTTTDEAHVIEKIPAGRYTLTEVKAPKGYEAANPMTIVVTATTKTQTFIMRDHPAETEETETEEIVESEKAPIIAIATASSNGHDDDGSASAVSTSSESNNGSNTGTGSGNSSSTASTPSSQSNGTSAQSSQNSGTSTSSSQSISTNSGTDSSNESSNGSVSSNGRESGTNAASSSASQSSEDNSLKGNYQVQTGDDASGTGIAVILSMIAALLALGFWFIRKAKASSN